MDQRTAIEPPGERSKLKTMAAAVAELCIDGSSIALGTYLDQKLPFAVAHECVRQGRRRLRFIGPLGGSLADQLVGAGVTTACAGAWQAAGIASANHAWRRATQVSELAVAEYTDMALSLALTAGAMGVPYLPQQPQGDSATLARSRHLHAYTAPVGGAELWAVEALVPDVAVIPVQRADVYGNSHTWGTHGLSVEAAHAAKRVMLVCEELVDEEWVRADPNRNVFPGLAVDAVVHEPWACHPSAVQGYYRHDHVFDGDYEKASATTAGLEAWLDRWVFGVQNRGEYIEQLGAARLEGLEVREHAYAPQVDYGY